MGIFAAGTILEVGGMDARHILSTGLAALPANADGVPFDCSHVYASGNLAADMYANVTAESTGRLLATRLYHFTDDPGMKDMLSFLIASDTMHQNQWLAVVEELGGPQALPIPNSFPQEKENGAFSYAFFTTMRDGEIPTPAAGRRARRSTSVVSSRSPASWAPPCRTSAPPAPTPWQKEEAGAAGEMLNKVGQVIDNLTQPAKSTTKH